MPDIGHVSIIYAYLNMIRIPTPAAPRYYAAASILVLICLSTACGPTRWELVERGRTQELLRQERQTLWVKQDVENTQRAARIRAAEEAGDKARKNGDKSGALASYSEALRAAVTESADERRVRSEILKLAVEMDPPPDVPEQARQRLASGRELFETVADSGAFAQAIPDIREAVQIAPWWSEAYHSLGLAEEGAGQFAAAARNLEYYLLGNPRAKDADDVRNKIRELELRAEKSGQTVYGGLVDWVAIPGRSFMMGSRGWGNAKHVRLVTMKAFEMARTLVTFGQYEACVDGGVCTPAADCAGPAFKSKDQPVVCVDWNQASTFAKWVGGRLPSEAEWEYAARGVGGEQKYPWGNEAATCEKVVMGGDGCGRNSTWPVCSKPKGNTVQGLCDMVGNVSEWVQDWHHDSHNGAPDDGSAWESPSSRHRVVRGGSWNRSASYLRAARRFAPDYRHYSLGFRPVRESRN